MITSPSIQASWRGSPLFEARVGADFLLELFANGAEALSAVLAYGRETR